MKPSRAESFGGSFGQVLVDVNARDATLPCPCPREEAASRLMSGKLML